eukprot:jgi/Bigna1/126725/aug1.3_g1433
MPTQTPTTLSPSTACPSLSPTSSAPTESPTTYAPTNSPTKAALTLANLTRSPLPLSAVGVTAGLFFLLLPIVLVKDAVAFYSLKGKLIKSLKKEQVEHAKKTVRTLITGEVSGESRNTTLSQEDLALATPKAMMGASLWKPKDRNDVKGEFFSRSAMQGLGVPMDQSKGVANFDSNQVKYYRDNHGHICLIGANALDVKARNHHYDPKFDDDEGKESMFQIPEDEDDSKTDRVDTEDGEEHNLFVAFGLELLRFHLWLSPLTTSESTKHTAFERLVVFAFQWSGAIALSGIYLAEYSSVTPSFKVIATNIFQIILGCLVLCIIGMAFSTITSGLRLGVDDHRELEWIESAIVGQIATGFIFEPLLHFVNVVVSRFEGLAGIAPFFRACMGVSA